MTTTWHDSPAVRREIGDKAEQAFPREILCKCGGAFVYSGDKRPGYPDFTCDRCGQLVDVKAYAQQSGNISVHWKPWMGYPDSMLLATNENGRWIGQYKRLLVVSTVLPFQSKHEPGQDFYLIHIGQMKSLTKVLGYKVKI